MVSCGPAIDRRTACNMPGGRHYTISGSDPWTEGVVIDRQFGIYPTYSVAYAIADSPLGPFKRIGKILQQDPTVATGAGHHSVIQLPGQDKYYIVYHRRPLGETDGNHRVVCIDHLECDDAGHIKPVRITFEGIEAARADQPQSP